jgi:outer membrane protein
LALNTILAYGLEASQLLFDGTYLVGLQALRPIKELSVKNSRRTRIETAVAVTKAYYSVLVNNEQLTLLDANIRPFKKIVKRYRANVQKWFCRKNRCRPVKRAEQQPSLQNAKM